MTTTTAVAEAAAAAAVAAATAKTLNCHRVACTMMFIRSEYICVRCPHTHAPVRPSSLHVSSLHLNAMGLAHNAHTRAASAPRRLPTAKRNSYPRCRSNTLLWLVQWQAPDRPMPQRTGHTIYLLITRLAQQMENNFSVFVSFADVTIDDKSREPTPDIL